MPEVSRHQANLDLLSAALESGSLQRVRTMLRALHPAEIGHLLESLPVAQRDLVWELTDPAEDGDVLINVNDQVRASLIRRMDNEALVDALEGMAVDDLADIIDDLPATVTEQLLRSMSERERHVLDAVRAYHEDSAGGLMDTDLVTIRPDVSLDVVMRYLHLRGEMPDGSDALFVLDRYGKYLGILTLADLVTKAPDLTVAELMDADVPGIIASMPATEVATLFEKRDLVSAAVVGDSGELLGRITIDDVVDVIRDEAEHSVLSMAGLDEEDDMFASVLRSAPRRAVWLGVNLLTALLASWVVGLFQVTINEVVALAVLMPVVASMGGIAGSQTLTLVIRGQALGQISQANARLLFNKELGVSMLNGVGWALIVAVIVFFWFDSTVLGAIIASAIVINMVVAALAGFSVPILLRRLNVDPALAGSVVLTTVTDVVGFFAFLGLGALFLMP